jgi:hypothetical protein
MVPVGPRFVWQRGKIRVHDHMKLDCAVAQLPAGVQQYMARLSELPPVKEGISTASDSRQATSKQAGTSSPSLSQPALRPIKGDQPPSICHREICGW